MVKILMIAKDFTEDFQTMAPFQTLMQCGHEVRAVCPNKVSGDTVKRSSESFSGDQAKSKKPRNLFTLNASFEDIDPSDYEALVLPAKSEQEWLFKDARVMSIVKRFFDDNKPVAASLHAREILATAIALTALGDQTETLVV